MKRIFSIPPNYFYFSVIFSVLLYYGFPSANLIKYPFTLVGAVLMVIGMFLVAKSWFLFKKYNTPETFARATHLVKENLYKYSRNPMYLGGVVFLLGLSVFLGNLISFIFPIVFFLVMHFMFIPFEETKMGEIFGQDYLSYKKEVRRWI